VLACFVKDSPENLVSDPFTFRSSSDTDGQGTWLLPLRKAIVDSRGHLRLTYWLKNDLVKGKELRIDTAENSVVFPPGQTATNPIVTIGGADDHLLLHTDKTWRPFPWLDADKTRKGSIVLNQRFDLNPGLIVEGQIHAKAFFRATGMRANPMRASSSKAWKKVRAPVSCWIGEPQWRESRIGHIHTDVSFHFETLDATGLGSATVTGLDDGKDHTFRLWLRSGQMELYIDDLLMQSFFYSKATGRVGFLSQESEVTFSKLRFYSMNL
jgi:hypothetical protein